MAEWFTRNKRVVTYEWVIPAAEPWGACWNQVQQALDAARQSWIDRHPTQVRIAAQDDRCVTVPDDAVRVRVSDEEIVVFYTVEDHGSDSVRGLASVPSGRTFEAGVDSRD